jgi:putative membrane protein
MQFLTLAILSAAVGLAAQPPAQPTRAAAYSKSMTPSEARFVQTTLDHGRRQVELGQIALEKSLSSDVKGYAERLINDQTRANMQLEQIAKEHGVSTYFVPSANSPAYLSSQERTSMNWTGVDPKTHTGKSRFAAVRLRNIGGEQFDQAYAKQAVEDQESAVSNYEDARKTATNSELRSFIDSTLPGLQERLGQARALK